MRTITTIIISLMTMAIQAQNVLTKATNGYIGTGRHMVQQVRWEHRGTVPGNTGGQSPCEHSIGVAWG